MDYMDNNRNCDGGTLSPTAWPLIPARLSVGIYRVKDHRRSLVVTEAMAAGITKRGWDEVQVYDESEYDPKRRPDVAFFYGLEGNCSRILADYSHAAAGGARCWAIYADLGYWDRKVPTRFTGFHKLAINDRHPTAYFMRRGLFDRQRALRFGAATVPHHWKWGHPGEHILIAGMGDKGAIAEGYKPEEWERWAITEIRKQTDRPIIYRPKPSWKTAKRIEGVGYSVRPREMADELADCWAVVTHHSNAAMEAIIAGVPAFCWKGVAAPLSLQDLALIEHRHAMTDYGLSRKQNWIDAIAYTQWNVAEMAAGLPWGYFRKTHLID